MSEHLIQRFLADHPGVTEATRARLGGGEDAILGMMTYTLDGIDAAYRAAGWLWADELIAEHEGVFHPDLLYIPDDAHFASPRAHLAALVRGYMLALDRGRADGGEVAECFAHVVEIFGDRVDDAYDTDMMIREMTLWTLPREFDGQAFGARMLPHLQLVLVWQRLIWLAECHLTGGLVISAHEVVALPSDQQERLRWLWALTAAQPELRRAPHLARVVLDGRMPRVIDGQAAVSHLARMLPPPAEGVVDHAMSEAADLLDAREPGAVMHASLGGLWGIERVVVSSEEPPAEGAWRLAFALEHASGWLAGELYCGASGQWLVESCQLAASGGAISQGAADALALLVLDTFLGVGPGAA